MPESLAFEYSLNGTDFVEIGFSGEQTETYSLGESHTYTFDRVINPVALRITLKQQDGVTGNHCVGLTEAEIMTYAGKLEYDSSAALSGITVDGNATAGFHADTFTYEAEGTADSDITVQAEQNVGVTILPAYQDIVRILTVSEDGTDSRIYEVTLKTAVCTHEHTEIRDAKEATCTEDGYTGDIYCTDCGQKIGDGSAVSAKGHSYDSGVVTTEPTTEAEGVKTYTCTACGETKTESIPKLTTAKKVPTVTVSAVKASGGKIALKGQFADYENADDYYTVTAHGLVYYSSAKLGTKNLTVNTPGRTRVNFANYKADGSFTYNMKPTYASTKYRVRAFLAYTDENGKTIYAYSDPITVSYNTL